MTTLTPGMRKMLNEYGFSDNRIRKMHAQEILDELKRLGVLESQKKSGGKGKSRQNDVREKDRGKRSNSHSSAPPPSPALHHMQSYGGAKSLEHRDSRMIQEEFSPSQSAFQKGRYSSHPRGPRDPRDPRDPRGARGDVGADHLQSESHAPNYMQYPSKGKRAPPADDWNGAAASETETDSIIRNFDPLYKERKMEEEMHSKKWGKREKRDASARSDIGRSNAERGGIGRGDVARDNVANSMSRPSQFSKKERETLSKIVRDTDGISELCESSDGREQLRQAILFVLDRLTKISEGVARHQQLMQSSAAKFFDKEDRGLIHTCQVKPLLEEQRQIVQFVQCMGLVITQKLANQQSLEPVLKHQQVSDEFMRKWALKQRQLNALLSSARDLFSKTQ